MRTVTIEILKYDELPTDKAKEKARQWMGEALANDPDSSDFDAIADRIALLTHEELVDIAPRFAECPLTGFYADHDALEPVTTLLKEDPEADTQALRNVALKALWEAYREDQESKQETDYLEDMLRANEYEFTVDGKRTTL